MADRKRKKRGILVISGQLSKESHLSCEDSVREGKSTFRKEKNRATTTTTATTATMKTTKQ
jgi:hypothetical protein